MNKNKRKKQLVSMKQLYAFGQKRGVDLSLSENPLGCSPQVVKAIKKIEIALNDYPVPNGVFLKKKLAILNGLKPANFFIANGSEAIICALPRLFKRGEVIVPNLTFPMFRTSSLLAGLAVKELPMTNLLGIDLVGIKKLINPKTKLIFLCNPNNPTGSIIAKQKIIKLLSSIPNNILLVIDEANIEFGGESMVDQVKENSNLIVLRTFSKGFGLASIRVGFAVGSEKIIEQLEMKNQPFATSMISEFLASNALVDEKFILKTKKFIAGQRKKLADNLISLGCQVFPSSANNIFVKLPEKISEKEFENMLEKNDISLVMGKSFPGFDNRFFRVSIRDKKTNQQFIDFMKNFIDKS